MQKLWLVVTLINGSYRQNCLKYFILIGEYTPYKCPIFTPKLKYSTQLLYHEGGECGKQNSIQIHKVEAGDTRKLLSVSEIVMYVH